MSNTTKVEIDKNKSAAQYIQEALEFYIVPDLIRDNYPDMIKLIFEAESMDNEEREYWLQIMPIMDDTQAKKLMDILTNEKTQLKKIDDAKQAEEAKKAEIDQASIDKERISREKMEKLQKKENIAEEAESEEEDNLLRQLENL